ncbi:MAG: chemotaxis protein CheA [Polyangiaceae bacterium]|nr:chemotaxis protein CheA [Polyangiaceae bacterium]
MLPFGGEAMDEEQLEILRDFITESTEALETVEPLLVELEQHPGDAIDEQTLAAIFRFFHSMKGTASFLELQHVVRVTHVAESLLDLVRKGSTPLTPTHVDLLCETVDVVRILLQCVETTHTDATCDPDRVEDLAKRLDAAVNKAINTIPEPGAAKAPSSFLVLDAWEATEEDKAGSMFANLISPEMVDKFRIESEEHLESVEEALMGLDVGTPDMELIEVAFRGMHSIKGNAGLFGFTALSKLAHSMETTLDELRAKTLTISSDVVDGLLKANDQIRVELRKATNPEPEQPQVAANDAEPGKAPPPKAEHGEAQRAGSIRVDTEKLDELMDLVGELIIAETTVTRNPDLEGLHFENFQKAALQLNRLTRRLQNIAMAVRMVPIASTFRKMLRLVRDVSSKQHKKVDLIIDGEHTEVDKTVVELISDPLVHMIRNAVDHGLESPADRLAVGKPENGTVWLTATHEGQEVWITIRDNGRGLNTERIRAKALEKGLIDPEKEYKPEEIHRMIFAPGFSTAEQVTDLSGRGVGMDVALRNIESMNGRVEIESRPGEGTIFTLRIPLTLAIIEGMLLKVGDSHYTIPLLSIREHVRAQLKDLVMLPDGTEMFKIREKLFPVVRLHEVHNIKPKAHNIDEGILILVQDGPQTLCVLVDEVVGQRQTVIKPVPDYLKGVRGVAGCSILHNGEISLILDVEGLAKHRAAAA